MNCTCGGETYDSTHEVKTKEKASEWAHREVEPPIQVEQTKCVCGRIMVRIYKDGKLIEKRG